MMTSTVAPCDPLLSSSRSFDSLCFLPSAKVRPGAIRKMRVSNMRRETLPMPSHLGMGFMLVFTSNSYVNAFHRILCARAPDRAGTPNRAKTTVRVRAPNGARAPYSSRAADKYVGAPDSACAPNRAGAPNGARTEGQIDVAVSRMISSSGRESVAGRHIRTGQCCGEIQITGANRENVVLACVRNPSGRIGRRAECGEALGGRLHQTRLHLVRRQVRLRLQQDRHAAARNRSSHARTAQGVIRRPIVRSALLVIRGRDNICRVAVLQRTFRVEYRDGTIPGSDDVGLHHVVNERRTFRAVTRDQVIVAGGSAHCFHGSHGDHVGIVARRGDRGVAIGPLRVVTPRISRRDYNNDARLPGCLDGLAKRVELVALKYRSAQRQIDDADVVGTFESYGCLNGGNHVAVSADAILIQRPQINEIRIGCNLFEGVEVLRAGRICAVACDNARDVGSVTVLVVRFGSAIELLRVKNSR